MNRCAIRTALFYAGLVGVAGLLFYAAVAWLGLMLGS